MRWFVVVAVLAALVALTVGCDQSEPVPTATLEPTIVPTPTTIATPTTVPTPTTIPTLKAASDSNGAVREPSAAAPASEPAATPNEVSMEEYTTTPSGLQYRDLTVGEGTAASQGDTAVVHYTGWLLNGTKFDSSVDRGTPFEFPLGAGRVIRGWDEGVGSMNVGGKRELIIPPDLAYGDRGAGGVIPPGATLKFEVELLGLK